MYPITIGFDGAIERVEQLITNKHSAEALLTAVFTLEKLMKRSMRVAILARGFTWTHTDRILERKGFQDLKLLWDIYDAEHRELHNVIGNKHWQHIPEALKMRNAIVHGNQTYPLSKCEIFASRVVAAAKSLHRNVLDAYGADPWKELIKPSKSALKWRRVFNVGQEPSKPVLKATSRPLRGIKRPRKLSPPRLSAKSSNPKAAAK